MTAYPNEITSGEAVLDRKNNLEGVITNFIWDFGDGNQSETLVGFTSHVYNQPGKYSITVTVTNSEGGVDSTDIFVNGIPVIVLKLPLLKQEVSSIGRIFLT